MLIRAWLAIASLHYFGDDGLPLVMAINAFWCLSVLLRGNKLGLWPIAILTSIRCNWYSNVYFQEWTTGWCRVTEILEYVLLIIVSDDSLWATQPVYAAPWGCGMWARIWL